VLKTIIRILEAAEGPVQEIHAVAEELLGVPVCWSSLKDCLSTHTGGQRPRFRRLRRGWYRLASAPGRPWRRGPRGLGGRRGHNANQVTTPLPPL